MAFAEKYLIKRPKKKRGAKTRFFNLWLYFRGNAIYMYTQIVYILHLSLSPLSPLSFFFSSFSFSFGGKLGVFGGKLPPAPPLDETLQNIYY